LGYYPGESFYLEKPHDVDFERDSKEFKHDDPEFRLKYKK